MSSEDEFDDLQLDLSFEELEEMDMRTAQALSAHEAKPTLYPHSKVSAPHTGCIPSSDSSANTAIPRAQSAEPSRFPSEDSFADEIYEDPEFLKALDVAMTQTERLYAANSGPPGPSRLPEPSVSLDSQETEVSTQDRDLMHEQRTKTRTERLHIRERSRSTSPKRKHPPHSVNVLPASVSSLQSPPLSEAPQSPTLETNTLGTTKPGSAPEPTTIPSTQNKVKPLLDAYEELLTCTICSEYYVYPCTANPCGHTFCSPCISSWLGTTAQKRDQSCPTCRARCQSTVPNFLVGDLLEKHLQALSSVDNDWAIATSSTKAGVYRTDWEKRKTDWKAEEAKNTKFKPAVQRLAQALPTRRSHIVQVFLDVDDDDEGDDGEFGDDGS